jgi:hypothetical protein
MLKNKNKNTLITNILDINKICIKKKLWYNFLIILYFPKKNHDTLKSTKKLSFTFLFFLCHTNNTKRPIQFSSIR